MVRFLVEITSQTDVLIYPTPSNEYDKRFNVYEIDIKQPPIQSYWTEWGGYYDNFVGTQIELYYEQYLTRVTSLNDLFTTPFSIFLRADLTALINIPKHPWLYPDYSTQSEEVKPFLSSALNPDQPSNNIIRDVSAPVKLEIPSFTVKLSDNINGITLNQDFSVSLINGDGYFDDEIFWNLFNTPVHLKKAIVENPKYTDFKTIRNGFVENTTTTFDKFNISVSDRFRAMGEPVCDVISQSVFPSFIIDEGALGKNIPIVYGRKRVKLLKLNDFNYVAAERVTQLHEVLDRNGNRINNPILNNNIITTNVEADSAVITGYAINTIGRIIIDIVTRKTGIQFNDSNWNLSEANNYANFSFPINITIEGGNVRNTIQNVLKSDVAYFIQQNDGRFTLRRYGMNYNTHTIPSWIITKRPEKVNSKAQENYFSSCIINFGQDNDLSYLYIERENDAENMYKRRVLRTFNTEIANRISAVSLARILSDRYTTIKQTIKVAVGIDTSRFELLDFVELDLNINQRKFNNATRYFIKEINPSQDILTLEEI